MQKEIKKLINSPYRKELWKNSQDFIKNIEKLVPVSSVHLLGSFTTKKKRPADVDFIILLKTGKNIAGRLIWCLILTTNMANPFYKMLKNG